MKKVILIACILLFAAIGCQAAPTSTPVPPTATAVPPTATAVPPTATALPVPTATPKPHETIITFDDSVPQPQRVYLKDFFDMARREMGDAGDVAVFVSYDVTKLPAGTNWNDIMTSSRAGGKIFVNSRLVEKYLGDPESLGSMLVAYYFLVQNNLAGPNGYDSPLWLIYGSASHAEFITLDKVGKYSYADAWKWRAPFALKAVNSGSTLKVLEADPGARRGDLSPVGFMAVEMLANIAGEASITNYWKATAGSSWQTAFQQAFGLKVEEFYVKFDEWKGKGFEPRLKPKQ